MAEPVDAYFELEQVHGRWRVLRVVVTEEDRFDTHAEAEAHLQRLESAAPS